MKNTELERMDGRWEQAEVYIQRVRSKLFGAPEAPFDHTAKALEWIRSESHSGFNTQYDRASARLREWWEASKTLLETAYSGFPPGITASIGIESALLAVPGENGNAEWFRASTLQLARLAQEVDYLAEYLGLTKSAATDFVLTGTRSPASSRVSLRAAGANRIGELPKKRRIDIGPAEKVTDALIHRAVMTFPKSQRDGLTPKDRDFLALIDELRNEGKEPPRKGNPGIKTGVKDYWTEFVTRWNESQPEYLERSYSRWTSAQQHYQRIEKRLALEVGDDPWA